MTDQIKERIIARDFWLNSSIKEDGNPQTVEYIELIRKKQHMQLKMISKALSW